MKKKGRFNNRAVVFETIKCIQLTLRHVTQYNAIWCIRMGDLHKPNRIKLLCCADFSLFEWFYWLFCTLYEHGTSLSMYFHQLMLKCLQTDFSPILSWNLLEPTHRNLQNRHKHFNSICCYFKINLRYSIIILMKPNAYKYNCCVFRVSCLIPSKVFRTEPHKW